ncbi:hypothetical protein ACQ4M3_32095 [Leptolyngbya sp. AN03gr2]|uniref:hypothetical protein n=1 Tax=unclassified Leptolyngbya TaxID=2650499 RepID=UPI003D317E79
MPYRLQKNSFDSTTGDRSLLCQVPCNSVTPQSSRVHPSLYRSLDSRRCDRRLSIALMVVSGFYVKRDRPSDSTIAP